MSYTIKLYSRAYRDLDDIYEYISQKLSEPDTAAHIVDELEQAILGIEEMPRRGTIRRIGVYANSDYRQLIVKNYVIIYKVLDERNEVHIVTIRYAPSKF